MDAHSDSLQSALDQFFSELDPEERTHLLAGQGLWQKRSFLKGSAIFEEGSNTTDLYLILEGRVEITKRIGDHADRQKVLAVLEAGAIFGEGALLSDKPRSATVTALQDLELLVLTKVQFESFLKHEPQLAVSLLLGLLRTVNQRLLWTNHELVTLYEVAEIVSESKSDLSTLIQKIADKLASATHAAGGVISLENKLTQEEEIVVRWGGLDFSLEILEAFERQLGQERAIVDGLRYIISIRDANEKFVGVVVLDQEKEWSVESRKVCRAIVDQLGIAVQDYEFKQSELGRSKLKQENIEF